MDLDVHDLNHTQPCKADDKQERSVTNEEYLMLNATTKEEDERDDVEEHEVRHTERRDRTVDQELPSNRVDLLFTGRVGESTSVGHLGVVRVVLVPQARLQSDHALDHDLALAGMIESDEDDLVFALESEQGLTPVECMHTSRTLTGPLYDALSVRLPLRQRRDRYEDKLHLEIGRLAFNLAYAVDSRHAFAVPRQAADVAALKHTRGAAAMSLSIAKEVQDAAVAAGLVRVIPGDWLAKHSVRHRTILVPTDQMVAMCREFPDGNTMADLRTYGRVYLRRPKAEKKRFMEVPRLPQVLTMEEELAEINTSNARSVLRRGNGTAISPGNFAYDRIFNNARVTLDDGGRAYASIQNLPQKERLNLSIDGEPIVELDYSAFHPRLVYHLAGEECAGSPYDDIALDGFDSPEAKKDAFKAVAVMVINTRDLASANKAAARFFSPKTTTGYYKLVLPPDLPAGKKAADLTRAFLGRHPLIARLVQAMRKGEKLKALDWMSGDYASGMGVKLQRIDGDLALAIMLRFARLNKPCFGVHDSFFVQAGDKELLKRVMNDEYIKRFGFSPVIKQKEAK